MDQINWLSSISKVSSVIAEINDLLRIRVSVASDDDSTKIWLRRFGKKSAGGGRIGYRWMLTVVTLYWKLVEDMHQGWPISKQRIKES